MAKTKQPDKPIESSADPAATAAGSGEDLVATMSAAGAQIASDANGAGPAAAPAADADPASGQPSAVPSPQIPAPAVQVDQAASQPAAGDQFDLLQSVRELGFADVNDEREAMRRLVEAQRQAQQQIQGLSQLASYGREYVDLASDPAFQQFYAQRQATPAPARGAATPAPDFQQPASSPSADWCPVPSDIDLSLIQRFREVKVDPTSGQQITDFKPNTPLQIRQSYDRYVAGVEQFANDFTSNPRKVLNQYRDAEVLPLVRQVIQEELGRANLHQVQESLSQRIAAENPWIFARDARTNQPMVDPATGTYALSREGQQAYEMLQSLSGRIEDPRQAWELTRSHVIANNPELARQILLSGGQTQPAAQPAAPQPAAAASPAAAARQTQRNYLAAAAAASSTPQNRDGAVAQPGTTQPRPGRRRSPGEDLIDNLTSMGVNVT